uniref:Uncharacterized protein n=1 Tax=Nelumbo nucifera TaxID=4432 RepID=A0A822XR88_NELNU|nr:TPA_asm: hypothetical protein HUJ06_023124 [Nelumbo nucifera]
MEGKQQSQDVQSRVSHMGEELGKLTTISGMNYGIKLKLLKEAVEVMQRTLRGFSVEAHWKVEAFIENTWNPTGKVNNRRTQVNLATESLRCRKKMAMKINPHEANDEPPWRANSAKGLNHTPQDQIEEYSNGKVDLSLEVMRNAGDSGHQNQGNGERSRRQRE